ncbi:MAG: efflux RND transporter permease subunit [Gammaproteobacteria bacterium]|nr:efflux RND transporter permease subunit [Gammaproteobacteria bacterium]
MNIIRFSINNPLVTNLCLLLVVLMGVTAWYSMPRELYPATQLDVVQINTEFEGASPQEVETQVTIPIEEEFEDTQDIDYISSVSKEGLSTILIRLKTGSNVDQFMLDARTVLERIDDLPDIVKEPELNRLRVRFPVLTMALFGTMPKDELFRLSDELRHKIRQVPGVASVSVAGDQDWEIWVIADPFELAARRVSLHQVISALRNNLRDEPGGKINSAEGDIRLRGKGVAPDPEEIADIAVLANRNGGQLRLGDIATVERRFEEATGYVRFNGQPAINLSVTKTADASSPEVAALLRRLGEEVKSTLPANAGLATHSDASNTLDTRLNVVVSSAIVGLFLVFCSLYALLNLRMALVTGFGIPVSFLFAVVLLDIFGYSINAVSLFAFLIVLGMIVDDAIIVTENVYRHLERGGDPHAAAATGAREVFWPVLVATFTTIAAFLPMFTISGVWGEMMEPIPFVVCAALLGSLLEVFTILPSHAGHFLRLPQQRPARRPGWQRMLDRYRQVLQWCVDNRYLVVVLGIGILLVALSYASTRLRYQQFGQTPVEQFSIDLETPNTYSLEDTLALAKKLEEEVSGIIRENELAALSANVGLSFVDVNLIKTGSNIIQLTVDLTERAPEGVIEKWVSPLVSLDFSPRGTRTRAADEIIGEIRNAFSRYAAIKSASVIKEQSGPEGADLSVGIASDDFDLLQDKSDQVLAFLSRLEGVADVRHDQQPGKLEYRYELNERGRQLGISQSQLAGAVRSGFLGNKSVYVTWSGQRIPVRVIYPDRIREQSASLAQLPLALNDGRIVYLGDVAEIRAGRGLNQISRRDGRRMANISANVDSRLLTSLEATRLITEEFAPGEDDNYELLFLGEKKEVEEAFGGMYRALVISLALIFFMLVILFRSLLDTFLVLFTIPFGMIGVVVGHALLGHHLQFLSAVGMLALTGIIVNDSLILVNFANKLQQQGKERVSAVIEAGQMRARPILVTTITTFLGLSPVIFFASGQTRALAPMAVSLGFGLVFATFVILLALPCFYLLAGDMRVNAQNIYRRLLPKIMNKV